MWVKDWNQVVDTAELAPNEPLSDEDLEWMGQLGEWPDRKKTGVNFVEIAHTIEEIYLTGGEPTLALSQYALFDYCIENDLASNIRLKYNTNLTNVPDKMLEYWKHFKRVQLNCSIDAVGARDRYIRYPSNFEKIEENFDRLNQLDNVNIQIHCTVQMLNILALHELLDWMEAKGLEKDQLYLNILNHPESMNIRVLPTELKERAVINLLQYKDWPKVDDTLQYMNAEDWHDKRWQEFVDFNLRTDGLQKGNLVDACPEFKDYI
jgi:sulfatase maturation enzyme AslB (radical SAM superfamily)